MFLHFYVEERQKKKNNPENTCLCKISDIFTLNLQWHILLIVILVDCFTGISFRKAALFVKVSVILESTAEM